MKKVLDLGTHTLEIIQDEYAENPRSWDNLGNCIFFHRLYDFGDNHNIDADDYNGFDEMLKDLQKNHDVVVALPVYLYDHSGQTIRTTSFGDRWDSGKLGFIVAYRADIIKEYSVNKRISAKVKENVKNVLEGEIETLNQWIMGEVYGFRLINKETKENEDSCFGFYGDRADNGIFDYLNVEDLTQEKYTELFNSADWR